MIKSFAVLLVLELFRDLEAHCWIANYVFARLAP